MITNPSLHAGGLVIIPYYRGNENHTNIISSCTVDLCCWASTLVIAATASRPNTTIFDFNSCSLDSAASSFKLLFMLLEASLVLCWRFKTSVACDGSKINTNIFYKIIQLRYAKLRRCQKLLPEKQKIRSKRNLHEEKMMRRN